MQPPLAINAATKKLHADFEEFLKQQDIKLSPQQLHVATVIIADQGGICSWMRARRSGVTFLFKTMEDFFKRVTLV